MDRLTYLRVAGRVRQQSRDPEVIEFVDQAVGLILSSSIGKPPFDKRAYMRQYMRDRRAKATAVSS